ncbi:MAG TPA: ABC transporter permease [Bacteroidia bacterium]|nr:ABC transporter permease [Bacteroidia bacterium]HNU34109.1 ABC transporter permease [Bacteroidia bacterium]
MLRFLLKRIFFFLPVLAVVVLLAFGLSSLAPFNPLDKILESEKSTSGGSVPVGQLQKKFWIEKLGLDLPLFYFAVKPLSYSSSLEKIYNKEDKEFVQRLINEYGNTTSAVSFCEKLNQLLVNARIEKNIEVIELAGELKYFFNKDKVSRNIYQMQVFSKTTSLHNDVKDIDDAYLSLEQNKMIWKNYIPTLRFYSENRFHQWLFGNNETDDFKTRGIFRGDFGVSYATREPVIEIVKGKLPWTLFFSCASILLAFVVGVPLGVVSFLKKERQAGKFIDRCSFLLISIPVFVIAICLIYTFANPSFIHLLPASGIKPPSGFEADDGWVYKIKKTIPYIIIPLICYTYSSVAFINLYTKGLLNSNAKQQYMLTARAKGLNERNAVIKHALKNALIPLITLFGNVFPSVLAGSIVLETIFTIPGMGFQTWYAIQNQDYPFITCIVLLTGALTVVGFLISDILNYFIDPRISLSEEK